jgi:hypothetical protein
VKELVADKKASPAAIGAVQAALPEPVPAESPSK